MTFGSEQNENELRTLAS